MSLGALLSLLKAVACIFAAVAVVVRLLRVAQRRRVDFVWVGTALAALAFSANGVMVPERTVDAWMGGENIFHLIRNLLALSAVWCLRAALVQSLQRRDWSRSRTLPLDRQKHEMPPFGPSSSATSGTLTSISKVLKFVYFHQA